MSFVAPHDEIQSKSLKSGEDVQVITCHILATIGWLASLLETPSAYEFEDVAETKIGELAGDISTAEKDLVNATSMRTDEHTTFTASEAELMDAIDTLSRAVSILSKEMSKNPAFLQKKIGSNMEGLVETLSAVIDVASFTGTDRTKLMALVQSKENADEDDEELGAPAAAVYKTHSSSILDILADMKDKAEEELASLR
eukprot:515461-Amphidinium_carterae.1